MKQAINPYLPANVCIADGEPHVFGNRVYIFGSHDRPGGDTYCMEDYEFFSAPVDDLSSWSSKGINYTVSQDPLHSETLKYLYAPDVVQGNDGKFYLYYCLGGYKGRNGYCNPISVAVCDTPDGHYQYLGYVKNPDGSPYLDWVCFDPGVINDNGTIRIYFGAGPYKNKRVTPANAFILSKVYSKVFGKPAEAFLQTPGPLGANTVSLCDDMLTIKESPKRIADTLDFKGHAFWEACSIRKVGDLYYFVYSSENNHELCYATSKYPDKDFKFRGTIVSNGDIGINGITNKKRCNTTGTTHGGIECINGQWYVFYHRQSHGTDYSRQDCAEKIYILEDGSIKQAEMTSCGLNKGPLLGKGVYPSYCCCHLTNGKMPHIANTSKSGIPIITHEGDAYFVASANKNTKILYRYFDLSSTKSIEIQTRGKATIQVNIDDKNVGKITVNNIDWQKSLLVFSGGSKNSSIGFMVLKGNADILSFELS